MRSDARWPEDGRAKRSRRRWKRPTSARKQQNANELTPEERARRDRLESLRLSRARTLAQLERATRPAHREMLRRTLRALEAEMEELT